MALRLEPVDHRPLLAAGGVGVVPPGADVLLIDVERLVLVVDHAALGLGTDLEVADLLRAEVTGAVVLEGVLAGVARDVHHEHRQSTVRAVVEADALPSAGVERSAAGRDRRELAGGRVDGVDPHALVGRRDHVGGAVGQLHVLTDVDIAPELAVRRDPLHERAVEVVGLQRALLVVADHQGLRRVVVVHPDRRVVRRVAGVLHRLCLGVGGHFDDLDAGTALRRTRLVLRPAPGERERRGDHERDDHCPGGCHGCI